MHLLSHKGGRPFYPGGLVPAPVPAEPGVRAVARKIDVFLYRKPGQTGF